jgi:hypothetical protein
MEAKIYLEIWNSSISVQLKHMLKCDQPLFNIQDLDFKPKAKDKFYLLPAVNIPRVKVKQFNEENGTKTVRDINAADYIFGCNKTQFEYFTSVGTTWVYKMPVGDMEKLIPFFPSIGIDQTDISDLKDVIEAHKLNNENLEIYYSYQSVRTFRDILDKRKHQINIVSTYDDSHTMYVIDDEFVNEVKELQSKTIYNVNALINAVNAKNVIIDYEMFGQLSNMFNSKDSDNHVLAMEIMANSNINDSLLFIEMLFKEYYDTIYNTHTRNHVNFKSLCSTIKKDRYRFTTELDDIIKSLKNFNVLTVDKLDILMKHYHNEIVQRGDTKYFTVKTITVSDEIHEILNQNYTYPVVDDYTPETEEEVLTELEVEESLPEETVNTESLNIESVEEEPSFELTDVNVIEEPVIETEELLEDDEVLEETQDAVETIEEEIVEPKKEEEDESSIDWF